MQNVHLETSDIQTSALAFGCAKLFRSPTRRERQQLLEAAFDAGIRHFDVARMYGLGAAETELGTFARGKRDQLVLATKFGIDPGSAGKLAPVQGLARRAIQQYPQLRRLARRGSQAVAAPRTYDAQTARRSLETSLLALGTDHVDLLFLHEPTGDDVVSPDLAGVLEQFRREGKIRAWGISGDPTPSREVASRLSTPPLVMQLRAATPSTMPPTPAGADLVTFGVLGDALGPLLDLVVADPAQRNDWSTQLDIDFSSETAASMLLLAASMQGRCPVLFSSTSEARIARASDAFSDQRLLSAVPRFAELWRERLATLPSGPAH